MKKKVFIISFKRRSRDADEEYEFFIPENPNYVAQEWSRLHPNDWICTWGEPKYPDDLEKSAEEKRKFWNQFTDI